MTRSEEILKELQEISPAIAKISSKNVYSVPLNYFDDLAGTIMLYVKDDVAGPAFGDFSTPYAAPQGYFNSLADSILSKIKKQECGNEVDAETQQLAPLLNTISKKMVLSVPPTYFDDLSATIVNKAKRKEEGATIVSINWFEKSYKYAAAAAIVAVVLISTFIISPQINSNQTNEGAVASSITNIPAAVNKVSEDEILKYLSDNSFGPEVNNILNVPNADLNIEHFIENASDEDISEYLRQFDAPTPKKAKDI